MTTKRTYIDFDQKLPTGEEWLTTKEAIDFIQDGCSGLAHYYNTVAKLHNLLNRQWRNLNIVYRRSERGLLGRCRLFVSKKSIIENEQNWQNEMNRLQQQIENMKSARSAYSCDLDELKVLLSS